MTTESGSGAMSWRFKLILAVVMLGNVGCANVFRDFPDKGSYLYRMDRARVKLDANKYDEVITEIEPLIAADPRNADLVYLAVCAYAGRAGLRVLSLFTDIASGLSDKGLFQILAENFVPLSTEGFDLADVTAVSDVSSITDIETAKTIIENYGATASERNSDINYMAFFVYISRIGIVLNRFAYDPDTGAFRDGQFKACKKGIDAAGASTGIPNEGVDIVLTSLPGIADTASYVFGSSTDLTSSFPPGLGTTAICTTTENDPSCLAVRTLIAVSKEENSSGIGLGTGEAICPVVVP